MTKKLFNNRLGFLVNIKKVLISAKIINTTSKKYV